MCLREPTIGSLLAALRAEAVWWGLEYCGQGPQANPLDVLPPPTRARVKEYVFQAEKGKKQFHLALAPDLPVARGDGRLIGRVLDNLFSNAVKYTVRGGAIQLSITADEQQLIVKMQDDGEGIPDDFLDRIFDKFTQVTDKTGAARRKGTGLGLAFCRMVVEAHGGRISVTSSEGKGSTFTFTLPL
jgi:signal transduction histidine kinase